MVAIPSLGMITRHQFWFLLLRTSAIVLSGQATLHNQALVRVRTGVWGTIAAEAGGCMYPANDAAREGHHATLKRMVQADLCDQHHLHGGAAHPGRKLTCMTPPAVKSSRGGPATVAVTYARVLTDHSTPRGLATAELLQMAGLCPQTLDDLDGRIAFSDFKRLCAVGARQLDDTMLGLHLGANLKHAHLGPQGFALMVCRDVREHLACAGRYWPLTIDAYRHEFEERSDECVRYWRSNLPGAAATGRVQDELAVSGWLTLARQLVGLDASPDWVSFRHAAPEDLRDYDAMFRCRLTFGAPETAVGFDLRMLSVELPKTHPKVRETIDRLCARMLEQQAGADDPEWLSVCRREILSSFEHGVPNLERIAAAIDLSPRALRARLSKKRISFRALADEVRCGLALSNVHDPNLSLVDLANLLGFSEQTSFQRAFKRWTGRSPGEYRREARATA
jgi:AraC-like DNA-binding protein